MCWLLDLLKEKMSEWIHPTVEPDAICAKDILLCQILGFYSGPSRPTKALQRVLGPSLCNDCIVLTSALAANPALSLFWPVPHWTKSTVNLLSTWPNKIPPRHYPRSFRLDSVSGEVLSSFLPLQRKVLCAESSPPIQGDPEEAKPYFSRSAPSKVLRAHRSGPVTFLILFHRFGCIWSCFCILVFGLPLFVSHETRRPGEILEKACFDLLELSSFVLCLETAIFRLHIALFCF